MKIHALLFPCVAVLSAACLTGVDNAPDAGPAAAGDAAPAGDPATDPNDADTITYRALATHPGCSTVGLSYPAAQIAGYTCAAKEYPPATTPEDTTKPIILLIHGNSSTPADWENYPASSTTPMLSERLVAAGYHAFAVDMRIDLNTDSTANNATTGNPGKNIDHGWGVPIVQSFIQSVLAAYPTRTISIVGFSLGPTVIRDALRRLHRAGVKPFERIDTLVYASGAHHGVSTFRMYCGDPSSPANVTMEGAVACQMGDRQAFTPTVFDTPLNGPNQSTTGNFAGAYETPCLDGNTAYGQSGVCGGHSVRYTTVVMQDISQGTYQDEFVSQASAALSGADNQTVGLMDQDETGYFYNGLFKNHFGSIRSEAGLEIIMSALTHS